MKKIILSFVAIFLISNPSFASEWKIQNKWKISCGLTDKEALVINGKPKKSYNKNDSSDNIIYSSSLSNKKIQKLLGLNYKRLSTAIREIKYNYK